MALEHFQASKVYWPFSGAPETRPVVPPGAIPFLETAYREGFRPYIVGPWEAGASTAERGGWIVERGRKAWEVALGTSDEKTLSAFVDDFDCAAEAVLCWLRGQEAAKILPHLQNHLVLLPGAAQSFVLHEKRPITK